MNNARVWVLASVAVAVWAAPQVGAAPSAAAEPQLMFAVNPRVAGDAPSRALPSIWDLVSQGDTTGWAFSGGSPAARIDIGLRWQFNDRSPYGLAISQFDFVQYEAESSWDLLGHDLTEGTPASFQAMFEAYGPRHPGVWLMAAWIGGAGVNGAALADTVTTTDTLPRTLCPLDTRGDYVPFDTVITGVPDIGDGVIGWSISGSVVPEPATASLLLIACTLLARQQRSRAEA
jgi:hypothetical protein